MFANMQYKIDSLFQENQCIDYTCSCNLFLLDLHVHVDQFRDWYVSINHEAPYAHIQCINKMI